MAASQQTSLVQGSMGVMRQDINKDDQPQFSFSSKGSSYSGWGNRRRNDMSNMTAQWRQLYLSRAKLKAVSRTSALIAGFAMVAMVEVQLDRSATYDPVLLIMFSTVTTCLVAVHLFALMISTCMLPNIEAVSNIHNVKAIEQSPHKRMRTYIEVAWILSTGLGLVLFMIEIALLIWLKFITLRPVNEVNQPTVGNNTTTVSPLLSSDAPAWVATAVLIPVVILFAGFAVHFYRTLAQHRYTIMEDAFNEIETMANNGDELSQLQPGYHQPIGRLYSGVSAHSQLARNSADQLRETHRHSGSSLSGHFSVDQV
uniref:Calcium release-activated calcium channel protein 1 n=1 Tax=Ciona intestinalis TaxID=7719 RepID=F6Z2T6_CIOIN|nr:calcium release-activated calcium channel protein 1 [Ciona intestinalis]|eukprot:XP_002125402.1 calcium release-activated calcium channel protein 1 [Ciona intestinalis]